MSDVRRFGTEHGFRVWKGAGGAEHLTRTITGGRSRLRNKTVAISHEDDTMSLPRSVDSDMVLVLVTAGPPNGDGDQPHIFSEHVYPSLRAAIEELERVAAY